MERHSPSEAGSEDLIRYAEAVQDKAKDRGQLVGEYREAVDHFQHQLDEVHRLEPMIYALRESLSPYLLAVADSEGGDQALDELMATFPVDVNDSLDLLDMYIETMEKLRQELPELNKRALALKENLDELNTLPGQTSSMPEA